MHDRGKSDGPVVPAKPPNKPARAAAEAVEGRGPAKGNAASKTRPGHRAGQGVPSALDRVRRVARKDKDVRFTALLHHVDVDRLREAYWASEPEGRAGVDGVTWRDYGQDLEANLQDLHARVHRGAYRARPSRRVYIPKADGRQRPLGVAALEDKLLQRAVVEVLNAIYEADFLGFSYGFRPGRSPHRRVGCARGRDLAEEGELGARCGHSWVLRRHRPRVDAEVPRAPDRGQRVLRLIQQVAEGRSDRGRGVVGDAGGNGAGSIGFAAALERLPALRVRPVGRPVETAAARAVR